MLSNVCLLRKWWKRRGIDCLIMLLVFLVDGNLSLTRVKCCSRLKCAKVLTFMINIQGFWFFWLVTYISFSCNLAGIFGDKMPSFKQ